MPPGFPTLPGPAAASAKPLRKLRVLCLHGKRQNAGIFADRLSPLAKHADLVFLEADFDCGAPGYDVKESASSSDGALSWTPPRSPGTTCSAGGAAAESVCDWLPALLKVRRCWVASGPFDGVLGFSQGGALASLVCVLKDVFCPLLRFGVVCSGYWPGGDFEAEEATVPAPLPDHSDELQIFHFIGEKDGIVPPAVSRKGVPLVPSSRQSFFLHGGGHAVPLAMLQREVFTDEQSGLGKRARDEAVDAAAVGLLEGFQHSLLQKILENVQEGPQALLQENADLLRAWRENVEAERELLDATFALDVDASEDTNVNKIMDLAPKKMDNNFWCVENLACGREFSLDLWYPPGFGSAPRVRPFLFRRTIETANFFLHARYPDLVTHLNREVLQLLLEDDFDDGRAGGGATSRLVSPSVEEPLEVVSLSSYFSTRLHEDEGPQAAPLDIGFGVTLGLAAADWERSVQPEPEDDNDNHLAKKPACEKSGAASPGAGAASPHVKWWEREYEDDERLGAAGGAVDGNKSAISTTTSASVVQNMQAHLDVGLMREAYREFVDTCLKISPAKGGADVFRAIPGERGNQRRGRPFEFVLGLVGKPSAGKSTFFNALTAHEQQPGGHQEGESRRTKAEVAAHPFTTIEPNIGEAWLGVENSNSGEKIPFLVKDVAGLVPGAWAGRGRGNAFLNDLLRADVLAHVVDVTGRLDAQGEVDVVAASVASTTSSFSAKSGSSNTDGATATATARSAENVLHDIQFIREEVAAWIFTNVRAKFGSVWKLAAFNHDKGACSSAVDRFVALFTGYHCTPDFVRNLWLAWATTSSSATTAPSSSTSTSAPRSRLNFATYSEADLMSFVHCLCNRETYGLSSNLFLQPMD
eukprot:g19805.t1